MGPGHRRRYRETSPTKEGVHTDIAVSRDGGRIVAANGLDSTVLVWDVASDRVLARLTGLSGRISGLDADPRGDLVAAATYDGEIGLWSTADPSRPVRKLAGHDRNIEGGGTVVAFGPDGTLVSGSSDGSGVVHDVDVTSRLVIDVLPGTTADGEVVGNGHGTFVFAAPDAPLRLWDTGTREARSVALPAGAAVSFGSALSPDGGGLTVAVKDGAPGAFALLDTRSGRVRWRTEEAPIGAAFSPDGTILAVGDADGAVQLLDPATGTTMATLPAQPPVPEELERYAALELLEADETRLTFSPDGTRLAVAGPDGPVWLWDVAARRLSSPTPLLGHGRVYAMAFRPDGAVLATGGADEQIRLWSVADSALIGLMGERPQGRVYALAFAPDGRTLASAAPEREFWDAGTRQRVGDPIAVGDPLGAMAFTADGSQLAVASTNGEIQLVTAGLPAWIDIACGIANRDLTDAESAQYLDGRVVRSCAR